MQFLYNNYIGRNELEQADEDGNTVLHHAIHNNFPNVIYSLLQNLPETTINAKNNQDETVLEWAITKGQKDCFNILMQHTKADKDFTEEKIKDFLFNHNHHEILDDYIQAFNIEQYEK